MMAQLGLCALAYAGALLVAYDFRIPDEAWRAFAGSVGLLLIIRLALLYRFRLDRGPWRHTGLHDLLRLTAAIALGSLLFPAVLIATGRQLGLPASVYVIEGLLALGLLAGARLAIRTAHERRYASTPRCGQRAFIIGAGEAGEQLLRQLIHDGRHHYDVVGLIDDDVTKRGNVLHGITVLGDTDDLRWLAPMHRVSVVLIAIPSARPDQLRRIVERAMDARVQTRLLPPLQDLVSGDVNLSQVREVQVEDLLGREPVTLDLAAAGPEFSGKVVLITGAGGSIGAELARQVARFHPLRLILLERAESPLYFTHLDVARANPAVDVVPALASVTNEERLEQLFDRWRPDIVFHAAAYKHVPLLEANLIEGVWNNVIGTLRVARCAAQYGVRRFVLISTDKAVNPSSVLGATKLLAERVVLELPSLRSSGTDFRVVRFGNVLGSDGSVVPLFKRQLAAGGPLTVTHPEVRRYFMTIPEAVQLVLQASVLADGAGRIALLEMGTQVRIADLAEQLIRLAGLVPHMDVKIQFTGLRPGEKLEEELVAANETPIPTGIAGIRVIERNGTAGGVLAQRLRQLMQATAQHNEAGILKALMALVPEYRPRPDRLSTLAHDVIASRNGRRHATNGTRTARRTPPASRNGDHRPASDTPLTPRPQPGLEGQ